MKKYAKYLNFIISVIILKIILDIIYRILVSLKIFELKHFDIGLHINLPTTTSFSTFCILSLITALPLIYLIFQLIAFRKISKKLEQNLIFDNKSGTDLNSVANGFFCFILFAGLIKLFIGTYINYINNETMGRITELIGIAMGESIIDTLLYLPPMLVITLFVKIIAILLMHGEVLKSENDLTI